MILIFAGLSEQTHSITIYSPSEQTFSLLYDQYRKTLSCPCSQILIPYDIFLSITVHFHQVCSSDFVTLAWWKYLWGVDIRWTYQDAQLLSSHFRVLGSLCSLAEKSIDTLTKMLMNSDMISIEVLPQQSFQIQVDSLINTFIITTKQNLHRYQAFMIDAIRSNQFLNVARTTWMYNVTNEEENYILATIPVSSFDNNCTCASSLKGCSRSLYLNEYSNKVTLAGLVGSCLPINGLRLSTLQCFYDFECLRNISRILAKRASTPKYTPKPLNSSLPSTFLPTTLLSNIMDELFVEQWISSSNYSNYFLKCAPKSCTYMYVQRMDALYMIVTIVGLYGGLKLTLRFLVWHGLHIIRMKILPFFTCRRLATVHVISTEITALPIVQTRT